jgi:hypothetical protein
MFLSLFTRTKKPVSLQASSLVAVVPHDTNPVTPDGGDWLLYVTAVGNIRVLMADGQDIVFPVVNIGWQSILVSRVFATNTTITNILAGR